MERSERASSANEVRDRKSTRLNSSHTEIYTLSLHDALPIWPAGLLHIGIEMHGERQVKRLRNGAQRTRQFGKRGARSEEHTSELQSHRDLHSFPTRRSSDLASRSAAYRNRDARRAAGEETAKWSAANAPVRQTRCEIGRASCRKECRSLWDWSSDVCSSDLASRSAAYRNRDARRAAGEETAKWSAANAPVRQTRCEIGRASCRKECRSLWDWSSDVCSSDLASRSAAYRNRDARRAAGEETAKWSAANAPVRQTRC